MQSDIPKFSTTVVNIRSILLAFNFSPMLVRLNLSLQSSKFQVSYFFNFKVLELQDQLDKNPPSKGDYISPSDTTLLDEKEKAMVREMCNVSSCNYLYISFHYITWTGRCETEDLIL